MNKTHSSVDKKMSQLPSWLWTTSNTLPPMYRKIWECVREERQIQGELLVDTNKVFPLLLTSQLPTEVLGYIWSLANQKYSGQLTEQELYVVLALVAIAQASYTFNSLDVLHLLPTPPMPNLNVASLDTRHPVQLKSEMKVQVGALNFGSAQNDGRHFHARTHTEAPNVSTDSNDRRQILARSETKAQTNALNLNSALFEGKHVLVRSEMKSQTNAFNLGSALFDDRHVLTGYEIKAQTSHPNSNTDLNDGRNIQGKSEPKAHSNALNLNSTLFDGRRVQARSEMKALNLNSALFDGRQINQVKPETKQEAINPPISNTHSGLPDSGNTFQAKLEITNQHSMPSNDFSDEFSDFQSAPAPCVPSISLLDTKQGSAIGSRLANHNLGVKKQNDKSKKASINKNSHGGHPVRNSTMSVSTTSHTKDLMMSDRLSELFPKCTIKSQAKTVILKDTAIRSNDPPKDSNVNYRESSNANDKISPLGNEIPGMQECINEVIPKKTMEGNQQDLMSVQPVEDKYSALRVLVEEPAQFVDQPNSKSADVIPPTDDFGEFVSAEQPDPSITAEPVQKPAAVLDFLTDFEFKDTDSNTNCKMGSSWIGEISDTFNSLKLDHMIDPASSDEKFELTIESDKVIQKEDTISVNSIELGNGAPGVLTRSGSVPSLDLKSFLPTSIDDEQQVENMHQLIYWEWKQYMESCVLLLQVAANIFTSITSEVVLHEVLSSAQGYNFLCNLAEVAAVCRRVNFSHKEMDINIMGFDDLLMDIDRVWAEMEPFYANIPIVTELPVWPLHQGDSLTCSLCLTVVSSGRVVYNENSYHVTCANLWLNYVNNNLPALLCPSIQPHAAASMTNSHI